MCQGKELGHHPIAMGNHWELSDTGVTWSVRVLPLGCCEARLSGGKTQRRQVRKSFIAILCGTSVLKGTIESKSCGLITFHVGFLKWGCYST